MTKDDKRVQPMDPSIAENRTPVVKANNQRVCYAIKQLNEEVWTLFPETPVEYSNYTGRNVALDVVYDLSNLDAGDIYDFVALIQLIEGDPRVNSTLFDSGIVTVLVSMNASARTQDRRDPFGLAEAYAVLGEPGSDEGFFDGGTASETSDSLLDGGGA